ncbi:bifunctional 2-polyprenyl-6-hydroxyphenol methylase/3-demethylubiquinol 3-O-methyltransferase UbiG [uncultured Thiodictyon sp.]|jgi:2-polyprenyl-3-methyl-5-hydroxy-6-metoxy-1,4-benzoquinol methylase|uniref:class I SAM-dependent methyltransferase n=1 Tax=uncultured Thiodictyon sp. TaxID=1846217 RepID=UPI0026014EB4|nr:class I SAM-dependent methyltransferase [uncultured Thiodictyon sp.]
MGWLKEKYTKQYFLQRDDEGRKLPYGVFGVEYWERGELYPEARMLLDTLDLANADVLDIGIGRGDSMRYCLQHGVKYITGIDFAEASIEIARSTLAGLMKKNYQLVCDDALAFLENQPKIPRFTHVFLLDVIEHIPRYEVEQLLPQIFERLVPGGVLVIHTPFFIEDDDIIVSGGKEICKDSSDKFEATAGMHVNRYSAEGLGIQLQNFGFARWSPHMFFRPIGAIPVWHYHGLGRAKLAKLFGYYVR